jgi:hypothetical protein
MTMGECSKSDPNKPPDIVGVANMLVGMPSAAVLSCTEPTVFKPFGAMRKVIDTVIGVPGIYIVWQEMWTAVKFNEPLTADGDPKKLCSTLASNQFKYCLNKPEVKEWQSGQRKMHLMIILTPCAFADRGRNYNGGIYQSDKYIVASHAAAKPLFNRNKIIRFDKLAIGLLPYGAEAQSHFWCDNAPWVVTLLSNLPKDVKVLVALNAKNRPLWELVGVDMDRIVPFDPQASYYAREMYSLVPYPYGMHGKFGAEPSSLQAYARVKKMPGLALLPPRPVAERSKIVVISRSDRGARALTNHHQLVAALHKAFPGQDISTFVGTKQSVRAAKEIFMQAKLIIGPHGGAWLNMFFAAPGTQVLEIGYSGTASMPFPSFFFHFAQSNSIDYWLVLAEGQYDTPTTCNVDEVVQTAQAALQRFERQGGKPSHEAPLSIAFDGGPAAPVVAAGAVGGVGKAPVVAAPAVPAGGVNARLEAVEQQLFGSSQVGSLLARIGGLEKATLGGEQTGPLPARLAALEKMAA